LIEQQRMQDLPLAGARVLIRTDFNVEVVDGRVLDEFRLLAALPTLQALREAGSRIVIATHRGRPEGVVHEELRNAPTAVRLAELLGCPVSTTNDCVGPEVEAAVAALQPGEVLLLENLRFHPEEEANDTAFAQALARLGDVYVDDAFGTLHRAHASIVGVPRYLPAGAGLLVQHEIEALESAIHPRRPAALVLGGVKFDDKLPIIEHLLPELDALCLCGMVGVKMLAALGLSVVGVDVSPEGRAHARRLIDLIRSRPELRLVLPSSVVATDGVDVRTMHVTQVPVGWEIVDSGEATLRAIIAAMSGVQSVLWNGPVGKFEHPPFDRSTNEFAGFLAGLPARTVAAGGETTAAIRRSGFAAGFDHLSSGGGAALQLLTGQPLPGLEALPKRG
jgi:phosphoglycerate kinase